jgi:hypothetical protein
VQRENRSRVWVNCEEKQSRKALRNVQLPVRPQRNWKADRKPMWRERSVHHPEYPLERVCRHLNQPFQLKFAGQAQQLLTQQGDLGIECSHEGLTIRGETEEILGGAVETLRAFYGSQLQVGRATIRYHNATTLEEPWMGLRIGCAPRHFDAVKADLTMRHASIIGSNRHSRNGVIHASAPLSQLIGYASDLAKLTCAAAQQLIWLSHYAPVEDMSPDGDAA